MIQFGRDVITPLVQPPASSSYKTRRGCLQYTVMYLCHLRINMTQPLQQPVLCLPFHGEKTPLFWYMWSELQRITVVCHPFCHSLPQSSQWLTREVAIRFCRSCRISWLNKCSSPTSPCRTCALASSIFGILCWCLSCMGECWPHVALKCWVKESNLPQPCFCFNSWECFWPSLLPGHTACSACCLPGPPRPLLTCFLASMCHCQGLFLPKCVSQCSFLLNVIRFLLIIPSCLAKSLWKITLPVDTSALLFWIRCSLQTLPSPSGFLLEVLNRTGLRIDPCSILLTAAFQVG